MDIVDELRTTQTSRVWDSVGRAYDYPEHLPRQAADEIERLRAATAAMLAALEPFAARAAAYDDIKPGYSPTPDYAAVCLGDASGASLITAGELRAARAAIAMARATSSANSAEKP